jgi:hypothetical protein
VLHKPFTPTELSDRVALMMSAERVATATATATLDA